MDSKLTFHLCSALVEPAETKNKMILCTIRKEHTKHSIATILWTPGHSHLAETFTKKNPMIAKVLNETLALGYRTHPDASYVVMTDCPETLHADNSTRTDIKEALIEAAYKNCTNDAATTDHRPVLHCGEA